MSGDNLSTPMWITFFGFVKMSGGVCIGDNPLDTFSPTFPHHCLPHFTTTIGLGNSKNEDFFPLTLSGGPVFYYIYLSAKNGCYGRVGRE